MEKKPFVGKEKLEEICARYPTPFHLYDERGIRENARRVQEAFSWNPRFKEFFAVKACPNPTIIKILKEEGCGCDCSSMAELYLAQACGVAGRDIMFSSNETPDEEFLKAYSLQATINLDDASHLEVLRHLLQDKLQYAMPSRLCLRWNPGGQFNAGNGIMGEPCDAKYGMNGRQLYQTVEAAQALGVERFGLHAFLASNVLSNRYYANVADRLFHIADNIRTSNDAKVDFVNLSGGVGIPYRPEEEPNDIYRVAELVRKKYVEILERTGMGDVAIYTEMGRFMTGPYGCLVTRAIRHKDIYKNYIGVDACAANLMRPAIYGAYHHITVAGKEDAPAECTYDVVGSLCENNDKFAVDRKLPKVEDGDLLIIHDTGAHGFAMGYNYNGKLRSAEILLKEDGSFEQIRRAEKLTDYFATVPEVAEWFEWHSKYHDFFSR